MKYFAGERLPFPALRFNASSASIRDFYPRRGIQKHGPYDALSLGKDKISCVLIYPNNLKHLKKIVADGMLLGNGSFAGFQRWFRLPLEIVHERSMPVETKEELEKILPVLIRDYHPDITILLTASRNPSLYSTAKVLLLGNGIPSQFITAEKIGGHNQAQWVLENIALQMYAKIGGTPWTVAASQKQKSLVIGISRAQDYQRKTVVGFVTLFTSDGDYQFFSSVSPQPVYWEQQDEYRDALIKVIVGAYQEYSRYNGKPDEIIIHLCKRPGRYREVAAAAKAMQQLGENVPYALIHLNSDTNYRLFDTGHPTYVPQPGIKVSLSPSRALLFLDGRVQDYKTREEVRKKRGVPGLLEIVLDNRSTTSTNEFPRLVQQVFEFSRVNWRGFNAQAIPVTLNYAKLIANLIVEVGTDNWNPIASNVSLRDKAWFL